MIRERKGREKAMEKIKKIAIYLEVRARDQEVVLRG